MSTQHRLHGVPRRSLAVAGAVSLALGLAACSDGGDKPSPGTSSSSASPTSSAASSGDVASHLQHPTTIFGGAHNVFTQDISTAPTDPRSAAMVKNLVGQITPHWGGVAAFNAYRYNSSLFVADASTPRVKVTYVDCQKKGAVPPDFYGGRKFFLDVPVPKDAIPSTGTDAAMGVWDPVQDKFWEFWQMSKDARTGGWSACYGGRIDKVSTNTRADFPAPYGASASGLATAASAISVTEAQQLKIDHAVYLGLMKTGIWNDVSYPANRSDGYDTAADRIPIGTRLRLDPKVDVDALPLSPLGKAVARAAQKYGFLVSETAGAVGVATMSGNAEKARTGKNPWDTILKDTPDWEVLKGFPWDKVQVVQKDYGKPSS